MVLKVIDLFSGVGGMSLGAVQAGFSLVGVVELDQIAVDTHLINFPNTKHLRQDIAALNGDQLREAFKLKKDNLAGIFGGPPCQGFSSMGHQNINDPRNSLFLHYFRLVRELEPDFFVAENVPGILDAKYDDLRNTAFSLIRDSYELMPHFTICARDVGAPTTRTRVFYVGVNKRMITNASSLPQFTQSGFPTYKVQDALFGLPNSVDDNQDGWVKVIKNRPGTYVDSLSNRFPKNIGDVNAIERYIKHSEINGMVGTKHTKEVIERFKNLEQGRVDRISKAPRLKVDGFCPTLRAGTASDKGSYQAVRPIHPTENRVITPREAARLQGFPDWFQFHQTKWHSFRQIGNSVSPIVAEFVAKGIRNQLY